MEKIYEKYKKYMRGRKLHYDKKGVEELKRQRVHLKNSLFEMNQSTGKLVKRRQRDIFQRTLKNSKLIYDLNMLRAQNKKNEEDIKKLTT